jgi:hypothetical protein
VNDIEIFYSGVLWNILRTQARFGFSAIELARELDPKISKNIF